MIDILRILFPALMVPGAFGSSGPTYKVQTSTNIARGSGSISTKADRCEKICDTCKHKDCCESATYEYKNYDWMCLGYSPLEDELQTNGYQTFNGTSVYVSRFEDEPQTDNGIGCSRCEGRFDCYDRNMPHAVHCNNYGKITEPQHRGEVTEMGKDKYQSCDNCYYEYFDSRAYPCSRCIHNKPETDMWTEKVAD